MYNRKAKASVALWKTYNAFILMTELYVIFRFGYVWNQQDTADVIQWNTLIGDFGFFQTKHQVPKNYYSELFLLLETQHR